MLNRFFRRFLHGFFFSCAPRSLRKTLLTCREAAGAVDEGRVGWQVRLHGLVCPACWNYLRFSRWLEEVARQSLHGQTDSGPVERLNRRIAGRLARRE